MAAATLPSWGHRWAALSLLLLLVGGALFLLVARYRFYQDRLEQEQVKLARYERTAASGGPMQQLIARIHQDRNVAAQYLPQATPSLAAADLQQQVKAAVGAAGGTLYSTQALPPVEEGNAVKITVSANMMGETDSLWKILYALESQTPLLFVDNLEISAREVRQRLTNGRLANYSRVQLTVQFEVSGYLRKEGG